MLKSKKLEMGVFTEEDKEKMWETFRKVWKAEKEKTDNHDVET